MFDKPLARLCLYAAVSALVAGCSGGEGNQADTNQAEATAAAEGEVPTEAEAAVLANQAADAEAADTSTFGGNAAAGETGNTF
ncbi:MAG TPA: hypothetical protein VGC35_13520 [Allosphingosinicella sp.]